MIEKRTLLHAKNVAIYLAIYNHYSLLDVILKSLESFNCNITLFISSELKDIYQADKRVTRIEIISQRKLVKRKQFKDLNSHDFIIFDELTSFRELFAFSLFKISGPKLMIVHDCNTWFAPSIPKGLKNYLKHRFTQAIKRRFRVFAVAGSNMKRYLQYTLSLNNIVLIPFRYADFNEATDITPLYSAGSLIKICIPGTISKRRNYHELIDSLCVPELKDKIELNMLGKPIGQYGMQIIKKMNYFRKENFRILYSEDYIDNNVFDRSIRNAHLLLSDFSSEYKTNNGQREIYGRTKETGVAVLMLNKAKAGLLPASFEQMQEIKNQTLFYNNLRELPEIILSIYEGLIDLNALRENAISNAKKMDINEISVEIQRAYQIHINGNEE